jgi:hypothetical protein
LWPIEDNFYLIVTAWGDEASDPLVVNHKMNYKTLEISFW